jgi:serine/threonine-protein kinase
LSDPARPDDWRRLDALFSEALDWPEAERRERLRTACEDDEELFHEVSALLAAAGASDEFLATPVLIPPEALEQIERAGEGADLAGFQVERYRIERSIGRGGMASVWLAVRDDGAFRRKVALKIVRRGLDTDEVLSRFRAERQILSGLEHPNIARLYDAGSTDDGRPFLALEHVEGKPVDEYCDERKCTIEERLRLFVEIGRAVQFAHGRLVVHRDIKPSNILVTGDGEPKLLDFGIAKLLDPGDEAELHRTRTGVQPLTPKYASPEQVLGQPVTTASDVYQLGNLLYGLVTGGFPLRVPAGSRFAVQEAIVNAAPRRPSDAAANGDPEAAERRGTTPDRLARRLRGDLDAILLKALEKDPAKRYSSAIELVEDVRRHLEGRPIAAKRAGVAYRTRKYFQRNRWALPVLAAAVLVLVAYVATVERHGRQLERERNLAQSEAARATAVRDLLTSVFEAARPNAGGDSMSVRELVDGAAARIGEDLSTHPTVLAEMSLTVGTIYTALGRREQAREHLDRSVRLLAAEPPGPMRDQQLAMALNQLTVATRGLDIDSAGRLARSAYELAAGVAPRTPETAMVILETAHLALAEDGDSARSARLAAISVLRGFPDRQADLAVALQDVAHDGGDSALKFQEEALHIRRELFGEWHTAVAASLNDLAMIYDEREAGAGDSLMRRAIEIDRELLGPDHPTTLSLMNNYAWMLVEHDDLDAAIPVFREVLAVRERAFPEERWPLAYPLHGLGTTLMKAGHHEEAEQVLRRTVALLTEDPDSADRLAFFIGVARTSLSKCLLAQGRLDESEEIVWTALADLTARPDQEEAIELAQQQLAAIAVARSEASVR